MACSQSGRAAPLTPGCHRGQEFHALLPPASSLILQELHSRGTPQPDPCLDPEVIFLHSFIRKAKWTEASPRRGTFWEDFGDVQRRGNAVHSPPQGKHCTPEQQINGRVGHPSRDSMEKNQMQLSASSSATDCDIPTGKDRGQSAGHPYGCLPPSLLRSSSVSQSRSGTHTQTRFLTNL